MLISTIVGCVKPKTLPYETTILVRDCCLCLHVQRAARALGRRFDEALRPFDLTNGQFSLLMALNRLSRAHGRWPTCSHGSHHADGALKPLERRGWSKSHKTMDAAAVSCRLLRKGTASC